MSYDPKYRKWVERRTDKKEVEGLSESNEIYQVYRGMPVFRVKVGDNPPQYRFIAPGTRAREFDRLCEKIDQKLDKTPTNRVRDKVSRKDADKQDSYEATYFQKWQNCQVELEDMKRREIRMLSKLEELQVKMDELGLAQLQLKNQLKASEELIKDLKKK